MQYMDIDINEFEPKEEYPKINKSNPKDPATIHELINAYTDNKGELTAIMQYIYQSFYVKPNEETKRLSSILERISIREMIHLELLSQLLLSFDVNPKFCTYIDHNPHICDPWKSSELKYITDIVEFLKYDISLEETAIKVYTHIIETTPVENVKEVVTHILHDEENHLRIFKLLLNDTQS